MFVFFLFVEKESVSVMQSVGEYNKNVVEIKSGLWEWCKSALLFIFSYYYLYCMVAFQIYKYVK